MFVCNAGVLLLRFRPRRRAPPPRTPSRTPSRCLSTAKSCRSLASGAAAAQSPARSKPGLLNTTAHRGTLLAFAGEGGPTCRACGSSRYTKWQGRRPGRRAWNWRLLVAGRCVFPAAPVCCARSLHIGHAPCPSRALRLHGPRCHGPCLLAELCSTAHGLAPIVLIHDICGRGDARNTPAEVRRDTARSAGVLLFSRYQPLPERWS